MFASVISTQRKYRRATLSLVISGLLLSAAPSFAQSVESRVQRLERLMGSQVLNEMNDHVSRLQREVQQLQGQLEEARHEIKSMKRRQRDLYLDTDRRLHKMEKSAVSAAQPSSPSSPSSSVQTKAPSSAKQSAPADTKLEPLLEQNAYEKAFKAFTDGRLEQAKQGFQSYLKSFSTGTYARDAQYWLGEIGYQTRDFSFAKAEFDKLIQRYPKSPKYPNALLKLGFIAYEQGDLAMATKRLKQVVTDYKGSTASRLAQNRLKLMEREGQ